MASRSIREMRSDFYRIKDELSSAMILCMPSYDQHNRLMLTLSELLLEAIECAEQRRLFKPLTILSAFDVMDSCEAPANDGQKVLQTFARSFVLFMDSLSGFCTFSEIQEAKNQTEPSGFHRPQHYQSALQAKKRALARESKITERDEREAEKAKKPRLFPPQSSVPAILRRAPTVKLQQRRPVPIIRTEQFEKIHKSPEKSNTSSYDENATAGAIKEEEIDEYPLFSSESNSLEHQVKEEEIEEGLPEIPETRDGDNVKEEPIEAIEAPMRDTICFGSVASTSSAHNGSGTAQPKTPTISMAPLVNPTQCPYCDEIRARAKLETHIKISHKRKWLRHVKTCPEEECDFRSENASVINEHVKKFHNEKLRKWRPTLQDIFLVLTRCPFCPRYIKSISQFIEHMEMEHRRLCTYDTPIMKCNCCHFTASRCHQMFEHWADRYPKCPLGMTFLYQTAAKVKMLDRTRLVEEVRLAPSPPPG